MQTRRKSLNLGDLGVIAPKRSRAISHPAPPDTLTEGDEPTIKRTKRSHTSGSPSPGLMSPPSRQHSRTKSEQSKLDISEISPPPSPAPEGVHKIDIEGINDDIVIGVIRQIETTGNRPHLVRELAAVLTHSNASVEKSANQNALISSRLTAYLQRPWPGMSPCPLAKEISTVHPRRLYYYLTTTPRQPIPTHELPPPKPVARIISPSLSSESIADEEQRHVRDRQAMSPSPEVDLSSADFESEHGPTSAVLGSSFPGRNSLPRDRPSFTPQRRSSPPLETEERDFKQTATALHEQAQARRSSLKDVPMTGADKHAFIPSSSDTSDTTITASIEMADPDHRATTAELFNLRPPAANHFELSSPMMKPQPDLRISTVMVSDTAPLHHQEDVDHAMLDRSPSSDSGKGVMMTEGEFAFAAVDNLQCPEDIQLDELEDLFDAY